MKRERKRNQICSDRPFLLLDPSLKAVSNHHQKENQGVHDLTLAMDYRRRKSQHLA